MFWIASMTTHSLPAKEEIMKRSEDKRLYQRHQKNFPQYSALAENRAWKKLDGLLLKCG